MERSHDLAGLRRAQNALGWSGRKLVVARSFMDRLLGLLLYRGQGVVMGFPRCWSVHTCFMRRPLDIAFIGEFGEVLRVDSAVRPWRVACCPGAAGVLEAYADERAGSQRPGALRGGG